MRSHREVVLSVEILGNWLPRFDEEIPAARAQLHADALGDSTKALLAHYFGGPTPDPVDAARLATPA
jgi:hypothetical protein